MATLFVVSTVVLLGTWVGYPLVMAGLAALRSRGGSPPEGPAPRVSVVVCTRGPAELVQQRVANLLSCDWPDGGPDVVVALDAGTPPEVEAEIRRGEGAVRVARAQGAPGKPGAVNAGVEAARSEVIVMCDTAQRFEADTLRRLAEAMRDPRLGAVSGQLELSAGSAGTLVGRYWRMERRLRRDEARVHSAVGVTGAVYALRRSAFVPLPADIILDDVYTPMAMVLRGWRVGFEARARAHETRTPDTTQEARRKERTLTGVLQLLVRLPGLLVPWKNAIFTQFVCHKLLRLGTPALIVALAVGGLGSVWRWRQVLPGWVTWGVVLSGAGMVILLTLWPKGRALVREFTALQVATVRAVGRALRGAWDVW